MNTGGIASFVLFLVLVVVFIILFLFYMNSWLCFDKLPRVWCFKENYDELESIPATEEEVKLNWRDIEDAESDKAPDVEDKVTVAIEDFGNSGEASKRDDDNRSDYSDERIDKFGTMVVNFRFEMMKNTLYIDVINVEYLPSQVNGGPSAYQIFIKIFNDTGRILKKWHSTMFKVNKFPRNQILEYSDMSQKDIQGTAVRFRLYGCERKRRDKLLSESIIGLGSVNLRKKDSYRIKLEKRAEIKLNSREEIEMDEDNYFTSEASKKAVVKIEEVVCNQSELLVGLGYHGVTGRLTIEIVKGNSFNNPLVRGNEKLPNSFVKITLCAKNSQVISKTKTAVCYNQANPLFKEKFMFQVSQFQLVDLSIIIGVYHQKSTHRKELMGWLSVG